jgi:hypothetical protein
MKRWFFIFLAAVTVISCSEGGDRPQAPHNPRPRPEEPEKLPEVKIATADNGKSVFEIMQFKISIEGFASDADNLLYGGPYLANYFDSLVWNIPGCGTGFKLFECDDSSYRFSSSFGHNFFTPGEIATRLSGYREGREIYGYDYGVTVARGGDFLCFDWVNVRNSRTGTGYRDVFTEDLNWHFATSQSIRDGMPSISLYIFPTGGQALPETRERELLFNLIRDLYGNPVLGEGDLETDAETTGGYGGMFHFIEPDSQPLGIWTTEKSKIVLLRRGDDLSDPKFPIPPAHRYNVYAEPLVIPNS